MFVDVGANVGVYTVLASAVVGAETVAIEPGRDALRALADNIRLNGIDHKVAVHPVVAGRSSGKVRFTSGRGTTNHVLPNSADDPAQARFVSVAPLSEFLAGRVPAMIKIDVEGSESEVIRGAEATFRDPRLGAVLMELNGSGRRMGVQDEDLHDRMLSYGLEPCSYSPRLREIRRRGLERGDGPPRRNVLYIRDLDAVRRLVEAGAAFRVLDDRI